PWAASSAQGSKVNDACQRLIVNVIAIIGEVIVRSTVTTPCDFTSAARTFPLSSARPKALPDHPKPRTIRPTYPGFTISHSYHRAYEIHRQHLDVVQGVSSHRTVCARARSRLHRGGAMVAVGGGPHRRRA